MQDFVPLGTGNSRSLKSAVPAGTTWEQALAMLRNGTFPIDIGAVNDAGVAQKGDPLGKTTLLQDATAALFGGDTSMVPDEVLAILSKAALYISSSFETVKGVKIKIPSLQLISRSGTDTHGSSHPCSITFSFEPDIVIYLCHDTGYRLEHFNYDYNDTIICSLLTTSYKEGYGFGQRNDANTGYGGFGKKSSNGKTIYWYVGGSNSGLEGSQLNKSGYKYYFLGLKME